MMANILKSAANLFIGHCYFAYLNQTSIKKLVTIISGIVITVFNNKFSFYSIYVKVKMIR